MNVVYMGIDMYGPLLLLACYPFAAVFLISICKNMHLVIRNLFYSSMDMQDVCLRCAKMIVTCYTHICNIELASNTNVAPKKLCEK